MWGACGLDLGHGPQALHLQTLWAQQLTTSWGEGAFPSVK